MKITCDGIQTQFSFEEYCRMIISVLPPNDIVGIENIGVVSKFTHPKSDSEALAEYTQPGKIEINFPNLIMRKIPEYVFQNHPEIAALLLSRIISHEVGHHVHYFHRHGIKKRRFEAFADEYAKAGYFNYFKSRSQQILSSYKLASLNFLTYDKETRRKYKRGMQELVEWLKQKPNGIEFP